MEMAKAFPAMQAFTASQTLHNFLFMVPASTTEAEQEIIVSLARRLTSLGYVYIASAHEGCMVDREDIRFMPLHEELLPSFGLLTGVFVVKDPAIASAARQAYPGTHVLMLDPARVEEDLPDYEPEAVIASWPTLDRARSQPPALEVGTRMLSAA